MLVTCQSSQTIYLDIVTDYSGDAYINVFQRLFNRRGLPELIISDNGSSFTVSNVQALEANHFVRWKFSLEKVPLYGGFFERLMKSVKRCLNKSIGNSKVTYEVLLTTLSEV